jgi:Tfp pilus assembly protein PilX
MTYGQTSLTPSLRRHVYVFRRQKLFDEQYVGCWQLGSDQRNLAAMSRLNTNSQAGAVMPVTIVMLVGLAALTGLTVLSIKRSLGATTQQRAHAQAINAAESGLVVAAKFLRETYNANPTAKFTSVLTNSSSWNSVYGAGLNSGALSVYPFGDSKLGYDIEYRNNVTDPLPLVDTDAAVVIVVTGCTNAVVSGGKACVNSKGATARIEVEIAATGSSSSAIPAGYGQQNQNELGTGRLEGTVNLTGAVTVVKPQ